VRIRPFVLLCIGVLTASAFVATAPGDVPVPAIPQDHPRVYIRPADIPALQTKISLPEFSNIWNAIVSGAGSPSERGSQTCSALIYLLTGDTNYGRKAIDEGIPIIQASTDARRFHEPFHYLSMVYDWCYDLMTAQEKQDFITEFIRLASSHSPWYPAMLTAGSVVGHDTEGWLLTDQLPAGIAIYDENQIMYDAAAQLFFQKFVPARNYLYPGHWHHQGDSYIATRFTHDAASAWLFRRLGAGDVYTSEVQYLPYQLIYDLRPDGQQIRTGDTYDDCGKSHKKGLMCDLVGSYFNDPYLLEMADGPYFYDAFPLYSVLEFIFREPGYTRSPISQLPLTKYFPHPAGEMVARTGWTISGSSTDALIWMRIGKTFFGNHQKRDFGTFQIYYRGAQALATGLYEGTNS
ncbi:MAG: hypothetical protein KAX78_06800, partial [Phycisphaerae bacterium]|nr:hypothetical protein [Phycisphaerae bacterium]